MMTREPGGTPFAEKLRKILLKEIMHPWSELFLYEAARAEHFFKKIQPALKKHQIVLCDRFTDSTLAYQSTGRGLPWEKVKFLNQIATENTEPDFTIFLNTPPQLSLKKVQSPNRFEQEKLEFHQRVYQGFLKAQKENPQRWMILEAYYESPQEMAKKVLHWING